MISYITGNLTYKDEGQIVVECHGMGYDIAISTQTYETLGVVGDNVKVYTYLVVREDCLSLVGFSTLQEKAMFEKLITVSGVGPKLALTILSGMNTYDLVMAMLSGDTSAISKIKGVGKKTSERIVLELKDKLMGLDDVTPAKKMDFAPTKAFDEAVVTMMNLGLNKTDATNLIKSVAEENDSVENLITKALKGMN
ncbi:MAG: Holliday junction branch migration protein RuvA [Christensenellales bacterium]